MAAGFPIVMNGTRIRTSEALYQACRFPHMQEIQALIIGQKSPMTAKMVGKPYRIHSRPDWDDVRDAVMWWTLRIKLAQNWQAFSELLLSTLPLSIVEESRRDEYWGAKPVDGEFLVGKNVLGRMLSALRDFLANQELERLTTVRPLPIENFLLLGQPIETVLVAENLVSAHHLRASLSDEQRRESQLSLALSE